MRIAIIEDEPATARNLKFLLQEIDPDIEVLALLTGVTESVDWLTKNAGLCHLIFMDVRLNDGLSFEIFEQLVIETPVIFVTAYNDYALQAFKANGIDYILKPFDEKDLEQSLSKFKRLQGYSHQPEGYQQLRLLYEKMKGNSLIYKQAFLVHFQDKMIPLNIQDIAWFLTTSDMVYAHTFDNKKFRIDFTLEQLQEQLDPMKFFRVNRQFIIQRTAITEVNFYFNGRLSLKTSPVTNEKMLISKARVPEFKNWMNS